MKWDDEEFNNVTGRIERINMQFSKLLEEFDTSTYEKTTTSNLNSITPASFKFNVDDIDYTETIQSQKSNEVPNYYANVITRNRQSKNIPKHAVVFDLNSYDKKIIDEQLEKIYSAKKKKEANVVYNMKEITEKNIENTIVIDYSQVPQERALIVKKSFKDILFSEVNLNKQIDVWGAVKRFCSIQIRL